MTIRRKSFHDSISPGSMTILKKEMMVVQMKQHMILSLVTFD